METPGLCCVRIACLNVWGFKLPCLSLSYSLTPSLPSLSTTVSLLLLFFFLFVVVTAQCYVQNDFFFFLHPAIPMSKQFGINYISLPPSEL